MTDGEIEVDLRPGFGAVLWVFPLAIRVRIDIDGQVVARAHLFSTQRFAVGVGDHLVELRWFDRFAATSVSVRADEQVALRYRSASSRAAQGSLHVVRGVEIPDERYDFRVGERLRHEQWGEGTLTRIEVDASNRTTIGVISFAAEGEKRLDLDREILESPRR